MITEVLVVGKVGERTVIFTIEVEEAAVYNAKKATEIRAVSDIESVEVNRFRGH